MELNKIGPIQPVYSQVIIVELVPLPLVEVCHTLATPHHPDFALHRLWAPEHAIPLGGGQEACFSLRTLRLLELPPILGSLLLLLLFGLQVHLFLVALYQ